MMEFDADKKPIPGTFQLIDFDNSEYGYRVFDIEYNLAHWPFPGPTLGYGSNCLICKGSFFNSYNSYIIHI